MRTNYSQVAGFTLIALGFCFSGLVFIDNFEFHEDWKGFYSFLGMSIGAILVLLGLTHLMPNFMLFSMRQAVLYKRLIFEEDYVDIEEIEKNITRSYDRALPTRVDEEASSHKAPGMQADPPFPDEWNSLVRPVLHLATQYMGPTYYLNGHLQVIDWNLCFDLIFEEIIGELRGRHVNWFIARLTNSSDVFNHAREFPPEIKDQPNVDTERLVYDSGEGKYGLIEFEKIATKFHDLNGQQRGWAVTLMIRRVIWEKLTADLKQKIEEDKFWSIYSVSYNAVLSRYPGYDQLIKTVVGLVPDDARRVVHLGAGTGNPSRLLLESGRRSVRAVEKNMAMLDIFRSRDFVARAADRIKIVKSSAEHLEMLAYEEPFDAAVAVNVLYAVNDVPACLRSLNRILKMDATFTFSTTDSETDLTPLLEDIRSSLSDRPDWKEMAGHYERVEELNMRLQKDGLTTRYSRGQYIEWLEAAGFRVANDYGRHYKGEVIVVKATKVAKLVAPSEDPTRSTADVEPETASVV